MKAVRALGFIACWVAWLAACSLGDIDLSEKACPCGADYICDSTRNVCVLPGTIIANEGGAGEGGGGLDAATACAGDRCPCAGNADCKDPARQQCSAEKVCVECLGAPDTCGPGSYCNAANQCILGCKQESDCQISPAAPHCATTRHQCVECLTAANCTNGNQCSPAGECVEGCDVAQGKLCPAGKECCQDLCINTKSDPLNCNGCGVACSVQNATPTCTAGVCSWTCASGFAHCGTGNTGCETNTRTDVKRCGSCTRDCTVDVLNANNVTCNLGMCAFSTCKIGNGNCDTNIQNGCECVCGAHNQTCCPGRLCNEPGDNCVGSNLCK